MRWSHYAQVIILILFAFPIVYASASYGLGWRSPIGIEIAITYLAVLFAGPFLLIYAFVLRYLLGEKTLSLIAFLLGGLWIGFEIIHTFKNQWFS